MDSKVYVINYAPVALARPRIASENRVWDSQKHIKLVHGVALANQHGNLPYFKGPLHLDLTFYMEIPKGKKNKIREGTPHVYRPDLDNLVKFVCDIATGILYEEDCVVYSISTRKIYGNTPRTELLIRELE